MKLLLWKRLRVSRNKVEVVVVVVVASTYDTKMPQKRSSYIYIYITQGFNKTKLLGQIGANQCSNIMLVTFGNSAKLSIALPRSNGPTHYNSSL